MSNVDVPQENDSPENEIESPVDGPTPDWLKMATSSSSSPTLTEENTPDWLKNIQAGKGTSQAETAGKPEGDPSEGLSDFERLLAEEGVDLSAVAEERPEGAEGMSARDWMIATSDDEVIRKRIGAEGMSDPGDLAEDDPYAGLTDIERLLAEEGVDLSNVVEERPEGAEGMSARDWMISTSDDEVIRKRIGFEPAPAETGPRAKPVPAPLPEVSGSDVEDDLIVEDELPDWLREMEDEDELVMPQASVSADDSDKMVVEEDLPDWLRDVEDEATFEAAGTAALPSEEVDSGEAGDLPDWLRNVEEPSPSLSQFADTLAEDKMIFEEDLPDWLTEEAESVPASQPAESFDAGSSGKMVVEEELPDWLRQVETPTAESEPESEELPDWLQEVEVEREPETVPDIASVTAQPAPDQPVDEEDLPDWLREVQEETEEDLFEPELSAAFDDDMIVADELPDWLSEVQAGDEEAFEPSEPAPDDIGLIDEEGLPDWLREVQEETEELEFAGGDLQARGFEPESADMAPVAEDTGLIEEDELPDWLREVEEEPEVITGTEAVAPVPSPVTPKPVEPPVEKAAPKQAEPVVPKEIPPARKTAPVEAPPVTERPQPVVVPASVPGGVPDWLKKLRESGQQVVKTTPEPSRPAPVIPMPAPTPIAARSQAAPVAQPPPVGVKPAIQETPPPIYDDLPADPDARLKMAQSAKDKGALEEAARIYDSLIRHDAYLETIIEDMELTIRSYPSNYLLYQVMGDAMMRDGRLQSALEAYRTALEKLAV